RPGRAYEVEAILLSRPLLNNSRMAWRRAETNPLAAGTNRRVSAKPSATLPIVSHDQGQRLRNDFERRRQPPARVPVDLQRGASIRPETHATHAAVLEIGQALLPAQQDRKEVTPQVQQSGSLEDIQIEPAIRCIGPARDRQSQGILRN